MRRDRNQGNQGEGNRGPGLYQHQKVDREKTCPFLLRVFVKENGRHMLEDFLDGKVPEQDEIQIYTWMDATLGELADCVRKEVENARKKEADLQFSFIYPDFNGKYRRKFVGAVFQGQRNLEYKETLQQHRFVIGDYIDLSIYSRQESQRNNDRDDPKDYSNRNKGEIRRRDDEHNVLNTLRDLRDIDEKREDRRAVGQAYNGRGQGKAEESTDKLRVERRDSNRIEKENTGGDRDRIKPSFNEKNVNKNDDRDNRLQKRSRSRNRDERGPQRSDNRAANSRDRFRRDRK